MPATAAQASNDRTIEPGKRVGPITRTTTEADLRRLFGATKLRRTRYDVGEGKFVPATILFPKDAAKKLTIVWADAKKREGVALVVLNGGKSEWKTKSGVTLGTSLVELEKLNGRAFTFFGFDWAYAGTVVSWKDGSLAQELGRMNMRLSPAAKFDHKAMAALIGDQELTSTHPNLHGVDPFVNELVVDLGEEAPPASMNVASAPAP